MLVRGSERRLGFFCVQRKHRHGELVQGLWELHPDSGVFGVISLSTLFIEALLQNPCYILLERLLKNTFSKAIKQVSL